MPNFLTFCSVSIIDGFHGWPTSRITFLSTTTSPGTGTVSSSSSLRLELPPLSCISRCSHTGYRCGPQKNSCTLLQRLRMCRRRLDRIHNCLHCLPVTVLPSRHSMVRLNITTGRLRTCDASNLGHAPVAFRAVSLSGESRTSPCLDDAHIEE